MDNNKRITFIDSMKGIAILGVVIIHINAQFIQNISVSNMEYENHAESVLILLSYLSRFCVPLFIMITGFLCWDHKTDHLLKRLIKKLLPVIGMYIIWSLIYYLPTLIQQQGNIKFYSLLILGESAPPMYYIPTIYIPVVIMIMLTKKIFYSPIALGVSIICYAILQLSGLFNGTPYQNIGFTFIYALMGAMFNYISLINKDKQKYIFMLVTIPILYFVYTFFSITKFKHVIDLQYHYDYFQISILVYTLAIFGAFYFTKISFKLFNILGKNSMTIYYQHWIFYIYLYSIFHRYMVNSDIFFYIMLLLMTVSCSFIPIIMNVVIYKKINILKIVQPENSHEV